MNIKTNIKNYRIQEGYTLSEIANVLGCSISGYAKYESGDREPSIRQLFILADFYMISIDELLGHEIVVSNDDIIWDDGELSEEDYKIETDISDMIKMARLKKNFNRSLAEKVNNSVFLRIYCGMENLCDCFTVNDIFREIDYILTITDCKVSDLVKIFGVSRSGYYSWKKVGDAVRARNEYIAEEIKKYEIPALNSAGYLAVTNYLRSLKNHPELYNISVARVKRIMDEFEIVPEDLRARKNSLLQDVIGKYFAHNALVEENYLNRQFEYDVPPCTYWCIDITEIKTNESKLYMCAIIDLCGRYIVGYSTGKKMDKFFVKRAIKRGKDIAKKYNKNPEEPCYIHSDRGIQFRTKDIQSFIKSNNMRQSMSRAYNSNDNACIESFFSSLKCEYLYRFELPNINVAEKLIERYVKFYNHVRIHQTVLDSPFKYWTEYSEK